MNVDRTSLASAFAAGKITTLARLPSSCVSANASRDLQAVAWDGGRCRVLSGHDSGIVMLWSRTSHFILPVMEIKEMGIMGIR